MSDYVKGCCNECGYKADYIIDNNNYAENGYKNLEQVPTDKMLCGACHDMELTKVLARFREELTNGY
jgi:hypothetical protein